MLTYYIQWAQRFNDQSVETEIITNWRDDIDDSQIAFEVDATANSDYDEDLEQVVEENATE